jgi:hydrogenase-4 component E
MNTVSFVNQTLDLLLILVLLFNFFVLVTNRLPNAIFLVGLQGAAIGMMPLLMHESLDRRVTVLALATVAIKGVAIPRMLFIALRSVGIQREIYPLFGFIPSLLLGLIGTALALLFSSTLPLREPAEHAETASIFQHLLVPTSLSTVLCGFLILVTRVRAITQALGYLMLENGIFLFGLLLVEAMPFQVELGVLLDLFVAIFVMGIIIQHISRGFESDSTHHLSALKEE